MADLAPRTTVVCPHCCDATQHEIVLSEFTCGACDKPFSPSNQMPQAAPTEEDLGVLIKPLWLATKPSREAQCIRATLSNAVDDARFPQWALDYVPDYVWDLIDIAAQRGIEAGEAAEAKRQIERNSYKGWDA